MRLETNVTDNMISAIVPIYKPGMGMLNRCLFAVLPQVFEVIVTRERSGVLPHGYLENKKINYVVKDADRIGFGANVNYGASHATGDYLLILNDDVYLSADAVEKMLEVMKAQPHVGIVGMLTRYPDGSIYHAGKIRRTDGQVGHPHMDFRKYEETIKEPMEMENTNGACILVRRKAFEEVKGFDEHYKFYCEDDDLCMRLRQAGWSVWYTPLATGEHDYHGETSKMSDRWEIMKQSNQLFQTRWKWYFDLNRGNPGLGVFAK